VDFEKWEVRLAGVLIVEVEISWGGLQIHANRRQALFGPVELSLSPRSFDLLLMLAEAAPHMATLDQLKDRLLSKDHGDKALGQAISNLRDSLKDSGVEPGTADGLIENIRGEGYRLKLPPDHIAIITES
jgi:DNA-binding response OmpR family regulator